MVGDRVQQGTAAVLGACQVAQQQEQQRSQPDAGERQRDDGGQSGQGIAQGRRLQDELPFAAQQADVALGREGRSPAFAVAILKCADLEDRFIAEVARAQLQDGFAEFNPDTWTPDYTLAQLAEKGYRPIEPVAPDATATLVQLDGADGKQYWLGFQNYYAITRYNNSKMYAMAVYQLSQAIAGREIPPA